MVEENVANARDGLAVALKASLKVLQEAVVCNENFFEVGKEAVAFHVAQQRGGADNVDLMSKKRNVSCAVRCERDA